MIDFNEIFSELDDRVIGEYVIDKEMQEKFIECISILASLKAKGKLEYEFSPLDQNYVSHCIWITWKADKSGFVTISNEDMVMLTPLFNCMESFSFDDGYGKQWQFSCTIYKEKNVA